jgi:hypothetical protein
MSKLGQLWLMAITFNEHSGFRIRIRNNLSCCWIRIRSKLMQIRKPMQFRNPGFDGQLHMKTSVFLSLLPLRTVPAMSDVPKPGFLPQAADPVGESAGVAKPPPTSLTELVHGGGPAYRKHMVVNVRIHA